MEPMIRPPTPLKNSVICFGNECLTLIAKTEET